MDTFGGAAASVGIYDALHLETSDDPRPPWEQRPTRTGELVDTPSASALASVSPLPSTEPEADDDVVGPVGRVLNDLYLAGNGALREAGINGILLRAAASNHEPPKYVLELYRKGGLFRDAFVGEVTYVGPESIEQAVELARAHAAAG
jgi:hypothetical protein